MALRRLTCSPIPAVRTGDPGTGESRTPRAVLAYRAGTPCQPGAHPR
ncbi:MAG: hypothetical protein AVDCRST_MAG70-100 [uncultured Thermomicrobiales bacterium]|uniref:Uncharacterized protein n=1 Tax=uncultured Thermomicrobiales bacterium TaxID=1645740 RepID=A0A6J4U5E9_9BACT|nr:MAG: hypothetical protein AVDCRST_MAG70-100 [uncultured Thermomicrobiales bacterium]